MAAAVFQHCLSQAGLRRSSAAFLIPQGACLSSGHCNAVSIATLSSSSIVPREHEVRAKSAAFSAESSTLQRAEPIYTPEVEQLLSSLRFNSEGLLVAIAQHVDTGAILMQAFADRDAVAATLASGHATFFSRSRKSLWTKGESSRNFIRVLSVFADCDGDSIIYLGLPDGPTCHTGETTCYFRQLQPPVTSAEPSQQLLTTLYSLEHTIAARQQEAQALVRSEAEREASGEKEEGEKKKKPSWTVRLLQDPALLCSKIREEADELCRTLEDNEAPDRAASEMADVIYHSMVLLANKGVPMEQVLEVLRKRFSKSGVEEKASRISKPQ